MNLITIFPDDLSEKNRISFEKRMTKDNSKKFLVLGIGFVLLEAFINIFLSDLWGQAIFNLRLLAIIFFIVLLPLLAYSMYHFERMFKVTKILCDVIIFFVLIWSVQITLAYQSYTNHIMIYLSTILTVGALTHTLMKWKLISYTTALILFILQLKYHIENPQLMTTYLINAIFLSLMAIVMSRINLKIRFTNFMYTLTIEEKNKALSEITRIDAMTGIYNHSCIYELLETEIEKSKRTDMPLSIAMIDIDHFKKVNDKYGHISGDQVIKDVVNLILTHSRTIDLVGRYGGEEFLVILPNTDLEGAITLLTRIKNHIEAHIFLEDLKLTISIGVLDWHQEEAIEFVSKADEYLYQAKNNGRNRLEHK